MAQLTIEEIERLTTALQAQDYLVRVICEIEQLQRVVFHDLQHADWNLARRSAEQILIAELVYRYQSKVDGVFFALRALENSGRTWDAAIQQVAAAIHSYFTTPLGMLMRQDLFGPHVVFITPDAHSWAAQLKGRPMKPHPGAT